MADQKSANKKDDNLVNEAFIADEKKSADESQLSIAPNKGKSAKKKKSNTKKQSAKSNEKKSPTKKPGKKITVKDASTNDEKPVVRRTKKQTPSSKKAAEEKIKKEAKSIKIVEPEISAHDITIAVSSPVTENYSAEVADEDIEKLVAEAEKEVNEENIKAEAKKSESQTVRKDNVQTPAETKAETNSKSRKSRSRALPYRIISRIIAISTFGAIAALLVRVAMTNILPAKFFWPAVGAASLFSIFFLFKSFRRKTHLLVLTLLNLVGIAIIVGSIFGFLKINETMSFLDDNLGEKTEYTIYNVFVKKDSSYNSLSDVKGKVFHSVSDFIDTNKLEKAVKEQAGGTVEYAENTSTIMKSVMEDDSYIGLLNSGTYEMALEYSTQTAGDPESHNKTQGDSYEGKVKIIGEIKVPVEKTDLTSDSDITKESFIVYISGIDTRSGQMVSTSLSDVNIVMVVNPITRDILLVAIPRDYYVQLHGTADLPDKLTHAGSLGGVALSMSTIEDLLGFKFNHYIRVNFNAVINLVNAIGGITVNSDVNYDITAWTNKSCVFHPGDNQVNGDCALAFARERYAYETGDRHRGENQEQVIQKIFDKVSSSNTLVSKYSDILNALAGSFETTLTTNDITSFANMQLDNMSPWTITTYNLDGTTGSALTHSYPYQYLSVMYPDLTTVETAKNKIQEILSGQRLINGGGSAKSSTTSNSTENTSTTPKPTRIDGSN
ncbi:LCP family protein [Candidatus Saccharibacteria bacterium]|nr:LCP family protein [Candidatus Saccharibacteria bacterium]